MHRGVFLASFIEPPLAREMAACLACGEHAFVSHRSAAVIWGIVKGGARPARIDITLRSGCRRRPGLQIRRCASLAADETTTYRHIPITSPARTVLDLAGQVGPERLERVVAQAIALRLTSQQALLELADRHCGRRSARCLRAVLAGTGPAFTRSDAEDRFLDLVRRAQIVAPEVNARVLGMEVDFYWPHRQLVVEVDGKAFHTSPRAFERDRARDAELASVGIRVVRVTWLQLTTQPEVLLTRLGGALSAGALR